MINYLYVLLLALCSGCILNDIPYPVIAGDIKQITFAGQTQIKIDATKHHIDLTLNDTIDMRSVEVLALELSPDARSTIKKGELLDFSNGVKDSYTLADSDYQFTVSTYQDYTWTISVKQPLKRQVEVEGSVGDANIDLGNKTALVSVSEESTNLAGIVVRNFSLGHALATYSPDPYAVTNYTKSQQFTMTYLGLTEVWTVIVQQVKINVSTGSVSPWAKFAEVSGDALASSPLPAVFEYRKKSETEWQSTPATRAGSKISAVLKGLSPNTDYLFRAKLGEELAAEKAFRTEATPEIENMGFEDWVLGGANWFANTTAEATFWGSGNPGVTMVNKPSNTAPSTDAKEGKQAAKIETVSVPLVGLAAGSLFTGDFKTNLSAPLDSPSFSRPYAGRPTQLSFWYKYTPAKIDVAKGFPDELGKTDRCLVYVYLGDWEGTLKPSQLAKENTPGVIAYGEFVSDKAVSTYTQQTINIHYYDRTRTVKKILVVGTSSVNGDSYTGAVGSVLHWDALQFGWDPVE